MTVMERHASISACGTYRWTLSRSWDCLKPFVVFVMLNPSTADGTEDDATIRKIVAFAKQWGYGGLLVVNMYAFRATDPKDLRLAASRGIDVAGADNEENVLRTCRDMDVILAWGANGDPTKAIDLRGKIAKVAKTVKHLGLSKHGQPKHPLYLPFDTPLTTF